ncbi:non-ribosomal peptide synthetase [Microbacterium cremeum]|uniref:non-ribosomal peptide synthetase n=1 Tax=Microbacterium cremeum TaxID=2782169 RepID=UPI0018884846|nr:non-ribosomal peptide synthetase [Microbacterium cremeum]
MPRTDLEPGLSLLGGSPDDAALITPDGVVTYADLERRIDERAEQLGPVRRLVMACAANDLEPLVTYLAALRGGHPVLLVAPGDDDASRRHRESLIARFDPDVLGLGAEDGYSLVERREGTAHDLHPELALLASTSGSTGSPKLVRLSAENIRSNAAAIAEYLRLDARDRAATTLPPHYCYGLSVINSHLLAGAAVALTDLSVTDEGFWEQARRHRVTSFAGVPYTFELLDAAGFAERDLPTLRYVTQAGGRLAPEAVRRYAELGRARGFEFFVMYGQTEATARMAFLPPELAATAPEAIGRPIPGGRFVIDAEPGAETGELVYLGPNVMMGYAEAPEDLALGRTTDELRTGDVARRRPDGLYQIVGRMNRFVKVFGLRIDLDRMQELLAEEDLEVRTASVDERLLVFARSDRLARRARARAAALAGIPVHAVSAYAVAVFPRTASGKPDTAALVRHARAVDAGPRYGGAVAGAVDAEAIRALYAGVLDRPDAGVDDSFAGMGGDSLSYVEASLRLEALLGRLPRDWPELTARELAAAHADAARHETAETADEQDASAIDQPPAVTADAASRPRRPRLRPLRVETPAVLRALAIVLIVGTHADLFSLQGGAHLLLVVAGYNLARFQLAGGGGAARSGRLLRSAAHLAVPAVVWIGAVAAVTAMYDPTTILLINNFTPGDGTFTPQWQFWFLEAALYALLLLAGLFALPALDRVERRAPFAFALALLAVALGARLLVAGVTADGLEKYSAVVVVWLVALGWAIARARTTAQRLLVAALALVAIPGFFGDLGREAIVLAGTLILLWLPAVPLPRFVAPVVGVLAGSSMFVYLTHWQVYPPFEQSAPAVGLLLSFVVGIVVWKAYGSATHALSRSRAQARARRQSARTAG